MVYMYTYDRVIHFTDVNSFHRIYYGSGYERKMFDDLNVVCGGE